MGQDRARTAPKGGRGWNGVSASTPRRCRRTAARRRVWRARSARSARPRWRARRRWPRAASARSATRSASARRSSERHRPKWTVWPPRRPGCRRSPRRSRRPARRTPSRRRAPAPTSTGRHRSDVDVGGFLAALVQPMKDHLAKLEGDTGGATGAAEAFGRASSALTELDGRHTGAANAAMSEWYGEKANAFQTRVAAFSGGVGTLARNATTTQQAATTAVDAVNAGKT